MGNEEICLSKLIAMAEMRILGLCSFARFSVVPSKNSQQQIYIKICVTDSHLFSDMQICFDIAVTIRLSFCQGKVTTTTTLDYFCCPGALKNENHTEFEQIQPRSLKADLQQLYPPSQAEES